LVEDSCSPVSREGFSLSTRNLEKNEFYERVLLLFTPALATTGVLVLLLCRASASVCNASLGIGSALLIVVSTTVCFGLAHVSLSRYAPDRDPLLLPVAAVLCTWGLLIVARLAPVFLKRQLLWLCVSTLAMVGVVRLSKSLDWLHQYRYTWLFGGLGLLAVTLVLGTNPSGYGPRLWLGFGGVYFQPSELLKLMMVAYVASYLAEKRQLLTADELKGPLRIAPLAYTGPLLAMFGLALVLLAWQQDLGAAMVFFFTFLSMLYLATRQPVYVGAGLALFALAGFIGYQISDRVALRVDIWLNPWPEASDRAFQIVQSLLAIGAGGLFGQGIGMGVPTYIPAVHTDFVFAAIGEEFGLAGLLAIVLLYLTLFLRGLRIAGRAYRLFEAFLAAGLSAGLAVQSWIIMAGNAKVAPITGITLPFVSYGGSSLLTSFIALGLLIGMSSRGQADGRRAVSAGLFPLPLKQVAYGLSALFVVLAIVSGFWGISRAVDLSERDDNPRRMVYEERIVRGRILDSNRVVLADSRIESDGSTTRTYPVPQAAPVVGYASLRYGTSGLEHAFDDVLRGDRELAPFSSIAQSVLHRSPQGHDIQLTLDAALQIKAQDSIRDLTGAVVVMDSRSGAIVALASSPTFSPDQLDQDWDDLIGDPSSPLVNRATQGLYQPGTALQSVIVSELILQGLVNLHTPVTSATVPIAINGGALQCESGNLQIATIAEAYQASCPLPFVDLGQALGASGLSDAFNRWHLTSPVTLEIPTDAADWDSGALTTATQIGLEAIGQGDLTVSPLQLTVVAAALANDGVMPVPHIVSRLQDHSGNWEEYPLNAEPDQIISPRLARDLLSAWRMQQGFRVRQSTAIAGTEQPPHQWFTGITSEDSIAPDYVVTVLLEHNDDADAAARIGISLLQSIGMPD